MEISPEVQGRYLRNRREDLKKCQEYLDVKNFAALERIGHQLKGNGLTFGYPDLSEIGRELELTARSSELSSLQAVIDKFSRWIRKLS